MVVVVEEEGVELAAQTLLGWRHEKEKRPSSQRIDPIDEQHSAVLWQEEEEAALESAAVVLGRPRFSPLFQL